MNQLENGYSVSDTEDEKGGLISGIGEGDILSLKSNNSLMAGGILHRGRDNEIM